MSFPTTSSNLPCSVILTLGMVNGAVIVRLHTIGNNLHYFATFVNQETFNTQFLWGNIMPLSNDNADFILEHQAVTVPANNQTPISNIRQTQSSIPTCGHAFKVNEEEPEDPLAPPYAPATPSPTQSYYTPDTQQAEEPQYQY
jgi:hypothetical protein